jgi:hypothetical protein
MVRKTDKMYLLEVPSRKFSMFFDSEQKALDLIDSMGDKLPPDWTLKYVDMTTGALLADYLRDIKAWT